MAEDKRFDFREAKKLDSAARKKRQPPEPLVKLVAAAAPNVVLDLGAGTGAFALAIATALPAARVLALDIEPRMLKTLLERAVPLGLSARIQGLVAAADGKTAWPIADRSVDAALLVNLAHELDDRPAAFAQVRRVLAPTGRLIICDWKPEGTSEAGPPREHRVSEEVLRHELEGAGFPTIESHPLYPDFYVVVAWPKA